jgi:hypothetical protein
MVGNGGRLGGAAVLSAFATVRFLLRSSATSFAGRTTTVAAISTARGFFFGGGRL